jgi:hypothetical protein
MIYFIQRVSDSAVKIGCSTNIDQRLWALVTEHKVKMSVLGVMEGDRVTEREMHTLFRNSWLRGEWFNPTDDLLDFIDKNTSAHERQPQRGRKTSKSRLLRRLTDAKPGIRRRAIETLCLKWPDDAGDLIKPLIENDPDGGVRDWAKWAYEVFIPLVLKYRDERQQKADAA